jgi:hypothetical protein
MTPAQVRAYWKMCEAAAAAQGATTAKAKEEVRKLLHVRAFGRPISAKQIDRMKMFDDFKAAVLSITRPDDLAAQMRQLDMEKTRLIWAIREASAAIEGVPHDSADAMRYAFRVAADKFHTHDLESRTIEQLTQLRNTLCARLSTHRRQDPPPDAAVEEPELEAAAVGVGDENEPF